MMREDMKQHANTDSAEFSEGVEAGLNSQENTNNWKAGNKLGQALKDEGASKAPADESLSKESTVPLFLSNNPEGSHGNPQDEKDEAEE